MNINTHTIIISQTYQHETIIHLILTPPVLIIVSNYQISYNLIWKLIQLQIHLLKMHLKFLIHIAFTHNQKFLLNFLFTFLVLQLFHQTQQLMYLLYRIHHAHKYFILFLLNRYKLDPPNNFYGYFSENAVNPIQTSGNYLSFSFSGNSHNLDQFPNIPPYSTYNPKKIIYTLVIAQCYIHRSQLKFNILIMLKLFLLSQHNLLHHYIHIFLLFRQLKHNIL